MEHQTVSAMCNQNTADITTNISMLQKFGSSLGRDDTMGTCPPDMKRI